MTAQTRSLGEHVAARRNLLGISQSRAAKLAGVSRTTWITWERDTATPEDYNHIHIERVLDWVPGSVKSIFAGGQPTLASEPELDPARAAMLREEFQELSKEHGRKGAQKIIDQAVADWKSGHPNDTDEHEAG